MKYYVLYYENIIYFYGMLIFICMLCSGCFFFNLLYIKYRIIKNIWVFV